MKGRGIKYKVLLIFFLPCFFDCYAQSYKVFNLVHGTWGHNSEWHQLDGEFYNSFKASAQLCSDQKQVFVITFNWSGKFSHSARLKAGKEFAQYIQGFSPKTEFYIVAHSHGANIVFIASHIIDKSGTGHKIEACYALGAPINIDYYKPNMKVIRYIYNFFSFKDIIQPICGLYKRVLPAHKRIANLSVVLDGKEPGHFALRSPNIAQWLPNFHEICQKKKESFACFEYAQDGTVHFFQDRAPLYYIDKQRDSLLAKDQITQKNYKIYTGSGLYNREEYMIDRLLKNESK